MLSFIKNKLSPNLSHLKWLVTLEVLVLLVLSVSVLLYFSRQLLRQEAISDAKEVLDATVQNIDNVMLTVEQTVDNFYPDLQRHLGQPERMMAYSRKIVESNSYIAGCAISLTPNYYEDRELFMAYVKREDASFVTLDKIGSKPYTEQEWFTHPITSGMACWLDPMKEAENGKEAFTTFCHPITDPSGKMVGVVSVDLSINMLSEVIHLDKSSPNGYSVLLTSDGSYVVHPNAIRQTQHTVFTRPDDADNPALKEASKAIMVGETGYKQFSKNGKDWYVFYEPFLRNQLSSHEIEPLRWSICEVCPDSDIMASSDELLLIAAGVIMACLIVFFVICSLLISHQLRPLHLLTNSARHIGEGNYRELIPNAQRDDEIGQLQDRFQQMQRSLDANVSELERMNISLQHHGDMLHKASGKTFETDRVKSAFLHYISNQMMVPADIIDKSVATLCNNYHDIILEDAEHETETIKEQNAVILDLLSHIIQAAQIESGKEDDHD